MPPIPFLPWGFDLSDPGAKEALYDSQATGRLVGIDLGWGPGDPLSKLRPWLQKHHPGQKPVPEVYRHR